jgi:hypothetical protein
MFHDSPDDEPLEGSVGRRTPWQNAYVERVIGSIRRECVDHVIVDAAGLTACSWTTSCTTCAREHISCLATTRPSPVRLHRRRPVALSPFQKSAVCTIATNASQRSRRATPISYFRPHHPSVKHVCTAVMTAHVCDLEIIFTHGEDSNASCEPRNGVPVLVSTFRYAQPRRWCPGDGDALAPLHLRRRILG